jgi:hypothetical protein
LKRRIRARMAKTGESYSTARREVLKGVGTAALEQEDAPVAERSHWVLRRFLPGAAVLVVVGAVVGVLLIDSGGERGQEPKQPPAERRVLAAEGLRPGLRELLAQQGLLDRVRSVHCGAGRHAVKLRAAAARVAVVRLVREHGRRHVARQQAPGVPDKVLQKRAAALTQSIDTCWVRLRGGAVFVSAKLLHRWLVIATRAHTAELTQLSPRERPGSDRLDG